jgi:hypothetical protein
MLTDPAIEGPYPAGPECLPPAPRRVAWNSRARWLRTAAWVSFLFAPNIILAWGWQSGEDLRALVAEGKSTFGRVADVRTSTSRGGRTYHVGYTFEVAGTDYHGRTTVPGSDFATFIRGHQCPVTYLPQRPETNYPGRPGPELQRHNQAAVSLALIAGIGLGIWLVSLEFAVRRECDLARNGEPAVGRVTDHGQSRGRNQTYYWVQHEFKSAADEVITDWHYVPLRLWETLRPGLSITLLFDPARPRRHLPLYAFKYAYIVEEEEFEDSVANDAPDSE